MPEFLRVVPEDPGYNLDSQPEDFHTHPLIAAPQEHNEDGMQRVVQGLPKRALYEASQLCAPRVHGCTQVNQDTPIVHQRPQP